MVFFQGYCTEFNVVGRFIQNHEEAKCNEKFPRCDKAYSSADAYKCTFKLNHEFNMFVENFCHLIFSFKWKHILIIIVLKSLDLDCYQIVYDKRNKDYTTHLPSEKTTLVKSKDEGDNG